MKINLATLHATLNRWRGCVCVCVIWTLIGIGRLEGVYFCCDLFEWHWTNWLDSLIVKE